MSFIQAQSTDTRHTTNQKPISSLTMDSHYLIQWVGEIPKQFSVIKKDLIVDGALRDKGMTLVNQIVEIKWKTKIYEGLVLDYGLQEFLEGVADSLAEDEAASQIVSESTSATHVGARTVRTGKRIASDTNNTEPQKASSKVSKSSYVSQVSTVLAAYDDAEENRRQNVNDDQSNGRQTDAVDNPDALNVDSSLQSKIKYKGLYKKYKAKYKEIKEKYETLTRSLETYEMVELVPNSGISIKVGDLAAIKMTSNGSPTLLARNLFRRLFTEEELLGHSLLGKKCNANKSLGSLPALPPVNANKRIAIIEFCTTAFQPPNVLTENNIAARIAETKRLRAQKREITKSLSDFVREKNKYN